MTTFNTIDELLDILDGNPRLLEAVRSKILTDELIRLPHDFSEFKGDTEKRFDGLEKDMQGIRDDIEGMEKRLTEQVDGVGNQIDGLGTKVETELKAQGAFRGTYAQAVANSERVEISDLFAHIHGVKFTEAMPIGRHDLRSWLKGEHTEVIEALRLRERAWRTFREPDIVAAVHDLMAESYDSPLYYICVEASYSIDGEDVTRATDHAKIVHAVTGLSAYAVVAGVRLDDEITDDARSKIREEITRYVEAANPDLVYWHRLASSDLRPPEPH